MKFLQFFFYSVILSLSLSACSSAEDSNSELASNYPPDYSWGEKCVDSAEFFICRSYSYSDVIMRAYYKGTLKNNANLSMYVKVNGNDAMFPLRRKNGSDPMAVISTGSYNCQSVYNERGFSHYDCDQPTRDMKHVLYYAKNEVGSMNAFDIELAVVDSTGNWDSRQGSNYHFRIERSY